jgi:thiamine-monophosphate kinase
VNLSDLAAMGARPAACFVSVALPRQGGGELARRIYEGIFALARQFDTAIAGGDTNSWDGKLAISVTAVGEVAAGNEWRRSGARPGDQILVTGSFGGSILGKHLNFTPRVAEAIWLVEHAKGGAVIDPESVPIAPAARELASGEEQGQTPLDHALGDGEDFELILAVEPQEAERLLSLLSLQMPLTRIGRFVEQSGLWMEAADGSLTPLAPRGYEHRFDP